MFCLYAGALVVFIVIIIIAIAVAVAVASVCAASAGQLPYRVCDSCSAARIGDVLVAALLFIDLQFHLFGILVLEVAGFMHLAGT